MMRYVIPSAVRLLSGTGFIICTVRTRALASCGYAMPLLTGIVVAAVEGQKGITNV